MKNFKKEWIWCIGLVFGLRILYAGMGFYIAQLGQTGFLGESTYQLISPYLHTDPFSHYFINPWFQWDTLSYMEISILGYNAQSTNVAYMPLYPMLMRWIAPLTAGDHLFAGLVISTICFSLALIFLYEIVSEIYDPAVAWRSVIALAVFPTSFFLLAGYTESLFLALVLGCYYLARHKRWLWAAVFASLATLTRLQGIALAPVLLWMLLINLIETPAKQSWPQVLQVWTFFQQAFKNRSFRFLYRLDWLAFLLPLMTFIGYQAWLKSSGFGNIPSALNAYWKIETVLPWQGVFLFIQRLFTMKLIYMDWIDLIILIIILAASLIGLRILDPGLSLYIWLTISILFMRGTPPHLLASFSRYFLALFPVFMLFALLRGKAIRLAGALVSFSLQLLLTWVFLIGSWVA